ncbi:MULTISPECIES: tetratricopeptide repeat protein [unclassified Moorena]|uniref:tetratricopeptide repeat protein n=1 Tax=unclassified Moorena TaxID=2683338 RepID=UPI0013FFCEA5|nr:MULTISPECIES: tetratricopeptide repeat protein [unclassified Moorena]NEO12385.1 tetratricopeptide repeat protein [Moorena sp. SIO3E8]NEP97542.1 tetratricopeptide repeat protein [Moorena sp. SIO3F7]
MAEDTLLTPHRLHYHHWHGNNGHLPPVALVNWLSTSEASREQNNNQENNQDNNQQNNLGTVPLAEEQKTAESCINHGDYLWAKGQLNEAVTQYHQAIKLDPKSSLGYQRLGATLKQQGQFDQATAYYRKAIKLAGLETIEWDQSQSRKSSIGQSVPSSSERHCKQHQSGGLLEAVTVYLQQAQTYLKQRQWQQAIAACERAIKIAPDTAQAYKIWGNALQFMGQTTEAMGHYGQALEIEPDFAEVYANLGSLYAGQQKWEDAIAYYQKAIKLKPDLAGAYRNLAKVWTELGNQQEVLKCCYHQLMLELDKSKPEDFLNLGNQLFKEGLVTEAIACYRQVIEQNPQSVVAYQNLAEALNRQGKWQEANAYYRKLLQFYRTGSQLTASQLPASQLPASQLPASQINSQINGQLTSQINGHTHNQANASDALKQAIVPELVDNQKQQQVSITPPKRYRGGTIKASTVAIVPSPSQITVNPTNPTVKPIPTAPERLDREQLKPEQLKPEQLDRDQLDRIRDRTPRLGGGNHIPQLPDSRASESNLERDQSLESFIKAAQQNPDSAKIQTNLGSAYAQRQQWQDAIACYQKAIAINPSFAGAYRNLAKVLTQTNQPEAAADYWYQALTLEPNTVSAEEHLNLGNTLTAQGKLAQGIACYRQAIQLKPNLSEAYHRLGDLLKNQGQEQELLTLYQQAVQNNPQDAKAYFYLGNLFTEQEAWEQAYPCYLKATQLQPNLGQAHHNLGDTLVKQQRWEEAVTAYRRAIEIQPEFSWSYNNMGDALLKLERWQDAADVFRQAIELKPDFPWSYQNLGDALQALEQWDEAIIAYRHGIEVKSDWPWSYYNLGQALAKTGQWLDAIAAYRNAIELDPNFAKAYSHLGEALARVGEWDEAIICYEQAIDIDPSLHVSVYQNLGEALERNGYSNSELNNSELNNLELNNLELRTKDDKSKWLFEAINSKLRTKDDSSQWPHVFLQPFHPPQTLPDGSPWPKISIVTPSLNQGEFIEETILSVIHQHYPNVEHILIDGGSTDETMTIVNQYRDHLTYVVSEPDSGQSEALNKGFAIASGEILTWLNSDDRLAPGALYRVALAFYTSGADVVAGVCQLFKDGVALEQHLTSCPNGLISLEEILDVERNWLTGKFFYQPEVMFTRTIWEKCGASVDQSLFYSMDYELWARFAAKGATLQVIGYPVAQYRIHENQKTSTKDKYEPELLSVSEALRTKFNCPKSKGTEEPGQRHSLRIVCFNDTGFLGGAGIAHQRIAKSLALAGHQVIPVAGTLDWSLTPVDCTAEEVYQLIASLNPDLVVVGNIHNMTNPLDILERLTSHFPTIFVMHDQWLLTGRCAYVGDCENYTTLCDHECPTSHEYPSLGSEKIADAFHKKHRLLGSYKTVLVLGDSHWTTNWARYAFDYHQPRRNFQECESKFQSIYYGIDLDIFRPLDQAECRSQLNLPLDKFIILTGSQSVNDQRKGFKYLLKALDIANLDNILLVSFGHGSAIAENLNVWSTGYIYHPSILACYYSAADVFIGPSLQEAFGQTFIEAAACGTPAIGYGVGGVKEAILNRVSGRVVTQKTPEALAKVIKELYYDPDKLDLLGKTAAMYIANHFSLQSSYHSFMVALDQSGWVDQIQIPRASKFLVDSPKLTQPLGIKSGIPKNNSSIISGVGIQGYTRQGFGALEQPLPENGLFRPSQWLLWPEGEFAIIADNPRKGQLVIACRNVSQGQFLEVWQQGKLLLRVAVHHSGIDQVNVFTLPISLLEGFNLFSLKTETYHVDQSNRHLGVLIERITFTEQLDWEPLRERNQLSILMDDHLNGIGWLSPDTLNGTPVRWMEKVGSVIIDGINTIKPLQVRVSGMMAVEKRFISDMVVKVNGNAIDGEVQEQSDKSWVFEGIIPSGSLTLNAPFVLSIESPGVGQLSSIDSRLASLLVKSVIIGAVEG